MSSEENRKPKVLLVDDDELIFAIAGPALKKSGLTVVHAPDLERARKALDEEAPALLILDLQLPDGSGFDLLREIREERKLEFPVLILSVRTEVADRVKGFRLGAQDYISKPFAVEELQQRVLVHLPAGARSSSSGEDNEALRRRLQDDAVDMIIHDLKSPLSSIVGSITLLKNSGMIDASDMNNLLRTSERSAGRMLLMINDILDVRVGKSAFDPKPAPFALGEFVAEVAEQFKLSARMQEVEVRTKVESDCEVNTDKHLLFRIATNFVSNAVKVSPISEVVEMDARVDEGECVLAVFDRGPGVPEDQRERIFEKSVRLGLTRYAGNGIGLAFCRAAADALGGSVSVRPREGGGSVFTCRVPAVVFGG